MKLLHSSRPNPKREIPIRSKEHRLWIRSLACSVGGCLAVPEVHHVRRRFYTLGRRPGDDHAVPLCRAHHAEAHDRVGFEQRYRLDLELVAKTLWSMSPVNNGGWPIGS